jgi:hypothetical protein
MLMAPDHPWGIAMTDQPSAEMQVFAPLAGRTWTGRGPNGAGGDVARWEFILGGRALQVTHRLIGDSYGGRTIIFFEGKTGRYVFHYFTTGGFHTTGEIRPTADGYESDEEVHGGRAVTKVRGKVRVEDGRMISQSSYLRDGAWVEGHAFTYQETPDAVVGY